MRTHLGKVNVDVISSGGKHFKEVILREDRMEEMIQSESKQLFGQDAFYLPLKRSVGDRTGKSIPDGYLIDLSDMNDPGFYIVEVETSDHDVFEHIYPQVTQHINYFDKSKDKIRDEIANFILQRKDMASLIEARIGGSGYRNLDNLLDHLVVKGSKSVLIIIDEPSEELKEVVEKNIEKFTDYIKVIQFKVYKSADGQEEFAFRFEPFVEQSEESGIEREDIGTKFRFYMDEIEQVDYPRDKLFDKYGIGKHAQAFVYLYEGDKIVGLTTIWYKTNIDNHFKREGKQYTQTGRRVDVANLTKGMDVYVVETSYDWETGEYLETPRVRIHGKLREVRKAVGAAETTVLG